MPAALRQMVFTRANITLCVEMLQGQGTGDGSPSRVDLLESLLVVLTGGHFEDVWRACPEGNRKVNRDVDDKRIGAG